MVLLLLFKRSDLLYLFLKHISQPLNIKLRLEVNLSVHYLKGGVNCDMTSSWNGNSFEEIMKAECVQKLLKLSVILNLKSFLRAYTVL